MTIKDKKLELKELLEEFKNLEIEEAQNDQKTKDLEEAIQIQKEFIKGLEEKLEQLGGSK